MELTTDFSPYGYTIIEQLNNNLYGGRMTYKCQAIETKEFVVIKQFRFATKNDWHSYKEIEREIAILEN